MLDHHGQSRFHHCAVVASCAQRFGHTLVFLPAYSPVLNPIESLFNKWKTLIRSDGVVLTRDILIERMAIARAEIMVANCLGWIRDIDQIIALSFENHIFESSKNRCIVGLSSTVTEKTVQIFENMRVES